MVAAGTRIPPALRTDPQPLWESHHAVSGETRQFDRAPITSGQQTFAEPVGRSQRCQLRARDL